MFSYEIKFINNIFILYQKHKFNATLLFPFLTLPIKVLQILLFTVTWFYITTTTTNSITTTGKGKTKQKIIPPESP